MSARAMAIAGWVFLARAAKKSKIPLTAERSEARLSAGPNWLAAGSGTVPDDGEGIGIILACGPFEQPCLTYYQYFAIVEWPKVPGFLS